MASRRDDVTDQLNQTLQMLERELEQKLSVLGLAETGSTPRPVGDNLRDSSHMSFPTGRLGRGRGTNTNVKAELVNGSS